MIIKVTKLELSLLDSRRRFQAFIIAVLMLIGGVLESLSVSIVLPLVTTVLDGENWNNTWYGSGLSRLFSINNQRQYIELLLFLLMGMFIFKNIFFLMEYYIQYTFITRNRCRIQSYVMKRYLNFPYVFYLNSSTGEIIRNITGDTNQAFALLTSLLHFYTELFVSATITLTMIIINPLISTVIGGLLLGELLVINRVIKPIMSRLGDMQRKENAILNKWLLQAVNGIKSIKVFHNEKYFYSNFSQHAFIQAEVERKNLTISSIPRLFIETFTVSSALLGVLFIVYNGGDLKSIVPILSAFLIAATRLLPSFNRMVSCLSQISYFQGGLKNVVDKLADEQQVEINDYVQLGSIKSISQVELREISFSYPQSSKKILDKVSLTIDRGKFVGIIGESGSGKTTLVDIILGLLKPCSGDVYVDGIRIEDDMPGWLRHIAYIPQQIFLLDSDIRENVAFGIEDKEIDDDRVWDAISEAQLLDFVREQPDSIYTQVGEGGIRLSGGQRQRIGIARALYNDPDFLFFDEATSALDEETEMAVMESINYIKGKKTIIIITHRLKTLSGCDIIYRIADGNISLEKK